MLLPHSRLISHLVRAFGVASVVVCFGAVEAGAAPKVGVLLKDKSPGFWVYADQGAQATAAQLGAEVIVKAPPTVLDMTAQPRLLAALAADKIDALVIAPTNPEAVEAAVAALAAKGVKIVTVDTPLKDGVAQVFVGADQAALGDAAAKVFLSVVRDGDEVAMLRNNSVDRTVMIREEKLREALRTRSGLIFHGDIYASSDKDSEDERALLLLTKYPKVTAVFASATRGTLSTIKAIREKGLVGKVKVVGFGTYLPAEAAKAFEDGILVGWVAQEPRDLGVKAVRAAVALVNGTESPPVVRPDFLLVTSENFHSAEAQALLHP
ncbi:MAG TPA: substrate-binding domain-containing protein [Opitutaceae bacterium]|nr:substrate-binding domain-containing protein [Opitutaceae bacterium]